MKLYLMSIKSHCNYPDYESEIEAKSESEAVDKFYAQLKGEYTKEFIKKNMGTEDLFETK